MSTPSPALLVFDMDGVLVDVSASYREAIVQTVRRFCVEELGSTPPAVTSRWPEHLKSAGGFNNDWDLTAALVRCVAAMGPDPDIAAWARALAARGGGLAAVDAVLGPAPPGLGADGPIKDRFQQLYLGEARLIDRERLLASTDLLEGFGATHALAVATGRPAQEAAYTLEKFGLAELFPVVVTHDDVVRAKARGKPDPWVLLEVGRLVGSDGPGVYFGDTGDDMRAARAAGFEAVGISAGDGGCAARLVDAGALRTFDCVDDALRAVAAA